MTQHSQTALLSQLRPWVGSSPPAPPAPSHPVAPVLGWVAFFSPFGLLPAASPTSPCCHMFLLVGQDMVWAQGLRPCSMSKTPRTPVPTLPREAHGRFLRADSQGGGTVACSHCPGFPISATTARTPNPPSARPTQRDPHTNKSLQNQPSPAPGVSTWQPCPSQATCHVGRGGPGTFRSGTPRGCG